jgi:FkbM family methyltransferase
MIEFFKLAKNPRIGLRNAIKIRRQLHYRQSEICLEPTEWYGNIFLRPNTADYGVFEQVFRYTSYGVLDGIEGIKTVIDAGANIGLSSMYFYKRLHASEIVALEPEKANFHQARKNLGNQPGILLLNQGVWFQSGTGKILNRDTEDTSSYQVTPDEDGDINFTTIPEILALKKWNFVDLLKIDIEGGERELFKEPYFKDWIHRVRIFVIELHDWMLPGCSLSFFKAISELPSIECKISGENLVITNTEI